MSNPMGQAQTPPLINKFFHRLGLGLNKKAETVRDRRLARDEEKRLLDRSRHERGSIGGSVCSPKASGVITAGSSWQQPST